MKYNGSVDYDGHNYSDIININFLHKYNYEYFWGMCHGAKINPKEISGFPDNQFSKWITGVTSQPIKPQQLFEYRNKRFLISWDEAPKEGYINIFNLNYWFFLNKEVGGSEEAVVPISPLYNKIINEVIPNLNDLTLKRKVWNHKGDVDWEGPYTVCWMFNAWEPQTGFNEKDGPYLKHLSENIPIFTDNLLSNNELLEMDGVYRKNRFKSYTQFVNSLFWPSTLYFREFYHHFDSFNNQSRNKKWKFHYMTRRWYEDKRDVAIGLIKLIKADSIGITTSTSFNELEFLSTSRETINKKEGAKSEEWRFLRLYFKNNPTELQYNKRGYNLDDWGNEGICDNSRELLFRIYPLSNITILHEHQYHTSEKIIAHIILGKPFLPVYYKTLDNIQQMFDNDSDLKIPTPPFERYETIHDIMDKISHLCDDENDWIEFRDNMYDWVHEFREVLLEYMNNHNSMFNAIINNIDEFKK